MFQSLLIRLRTVPPPAFPTCKNSTNFCSCSARSGSGSGSGSTSNVLLVVLLLFVSLFAGFTPVFAFFLKVDVTFDADNQREEENCAPTSRSSPHRPIAMTCTPLLPLPLSLMTAALFLSSFLDLSLPFSLIPPSPTMTSSVSLSLSSAAAAAANEIRVSAIITVDLLNRLSVSVCSLFC